MTTSDLCEQLNTVEVKDLEKQIDDCDAKRKALCLLLRAAKARQRRQPKSEGARND